MALLAGEPSDSERLRMQEDSSGTRGTSTAAAATGDGTAFSSSTPRGVQSRPFPGALSARVDMPDLSSRDHYSGSILYGDRKTGGVIVPVDRARGYPGNKQRRGQMGQPAPN